MLNIFALRNKNEINSKLKICSYVIAYEITRVRKKNLSQKEINTYFRENKENIVRDNRTSIRIRFNINIRQNKITVYINLI